MPTSAPTQPSSQFPVLDVDRRSVLLVADNHIVHRREERDTAKHGNVPVHGRRRDRAARREEREDEEGEEKAKCDDVDRHAPLAEREARGGKGLAAHAFGEYAADGDHVRA